MESLKTQLPDLAESVCSPDLNSITQFFLSKSFEMSAEGNKTKGDNPSLAVDILAKGDTDRVPMATDR